jgi:hypothetical protein
VKELYESGIKLPDTPEQSPLTPEAGANPGALVYLNTLFEAKGENDTIFRYPTPDVIKSKKSLTSKMMLYS